MNYNPVGWFEIYVQDIPRAKKFYEAVLLLKLEKIDTSYIDTSHSEFELWTFPMTAGASGAPGALVKMTGVPSGGSGTLVYFSCQDCAVEAGRVVAAGGKIMREKFPIGQYGFIALAFDTEGNMFGLHSRQ